MKATIFSRVREAAGVLFKSGAPFPFNKIMPYDAMGGEKLYRAFEQSTWVMRAIKKIAGPISAVDLNFSRSGERYDDEELEAFWERPGAGLSRGDLIEATVGWLKLEGESFWVLDDSWLRPFAGGERGNSNGGGQRPPLQVVRPDRMRHVVRNGVLMGWEYVDGMGKQALLLPEQVVQIKLWNPYNDWRGLAELKPCRDAAEADFLAGKFNLNLMRNNGDQGVYVIAKNGTPQDGQRQQLVDQIREKRELAQRGVFKPVFLDADVTIEDPKIRVPDADFLGARLQNRHEVFIAMGVPASMADVKASYSIGSASDWFMLIAETCIPLGEKIAQAINQVVARQRGAEVRASFDWDEHPVIQAVRRERADTALKYFEMGVPLRELNDYLDLELPVCPGWEKGYVSGKLVEVGAEGDGIQGTNAANKTNGTEGAVEGLKEAVRLGRGEAHSGNNGGSFTRAATGRMVQARFGRELMRARMETLGRMERNEPGVFDGEGFAQGLVAGLRGVLGTRVGVSEEFLKAREMVWRGEAEEIGLEIEAAALAGRGERGVAVRAKFNEIAKKRGAALAAGEVEAMRGGAGPSEAPLRRMIHPEVRVVDGRNGIVDYVASDESVDSFKEIIRASGWRFTNFVKNAPFVDSHDYSTIEKCLGKVIDFRVEGSRLIERVQWAIDVPENKLAQIGWKMTQAGYLKAVSVGFFPIKYLTASSGEEWTKALRELGLPAEAAVRTIYTEQEQVELSCCVIGANPNALAKAYHAGAIDDADIETLSLEYSQRENGRAADGPALVALAREQARLGFLEELKKAIKQTRRTSSAGTEEE